MLFIVVGPSGSGKSSFIKLALECITNANVVSVDVCTKYSRLYEQGLGRTYITSDIFNQKLNKGEYSIINTYDNCSYGYNIPNDCNENSIYLIDYPGEYPECIELKRYVWKGILIFPPSEEILRQRLRNADRENRILSAIKEYKECLDDMKNKKFDDWFVICNYCYENLKDGVKWMNSLV